MKRTLRRGGVMLSFAGIFAIAVAQQPDHLPQVSPPSDRPDVTLPNGKSQRDEILKADREENIKDAAKLASLADELREALEKEDRFVFSLSTVKKTEEIERLAKKIRSRIRRD